MGLKAQTVQQSYLDYIAKYAGKAQQQQVKYGIPASITLAQGLLESGAGSSELAVNARNHFGIKCNSSWTGATYKHDDDAEAECFRVYDDAMQSYDDHSLFLKRARYESLFKLEITDYKGWAQGLKDCGYATDPNYPNKLINLIELYHLDAYDKDQHRGGVEVPSSADSNGARVPQASGRENGSSEDDMGSVNATTSTHKLLHNNGVLCVKAKTDDTYAIIADEFNLRVNKLLQYNDYTTEPELQSGDYVYLRCKRMQAARGYNSYTVREGDTGHAIAQKYAIRLSALYDLNGLNYDKAVPCGATLRLR